MRNHIFSSLAFLSLTAASSVVLLASCSKMGALSADNFTVTPNPLESVAGQVPATIDGKFPEKYMKTKAMVTVTPELRYGDNKSVKGQSVTFQGEKVQGNDQTISYKMGGRYTMKTTFPYNADMEQSELYLNFDARQGNKKFDVPAVKVANGVIATSELYKRTMDNAGACIAPDSFQRVTAQKQEASIKFLVNQAKLRKSELKSNSVNDFVDMLKKINADREGLNLKNVEIAAYASPEGGFEYNDKLSKKREDATTDYVNKQLKAAQLADANVDAHYTAQDWEGFKQLVAASDLQDKDVILRVLEMYKDPQERENQIKNMSAGFQDLATGILPELRRSRLIINYETVGRSDQQIKDQYNSDAAQLSPEELLYAASLESNPQKKAEIYQKSTEYYDKDYRGYNNLAALAFNRGDMNAAQQYIALAQQKGKAPEAYANQALIALKNGDTQAAESYISKAGDANGVEEVLGNLNIAKGNYAQAVKNFGSSTTNSAALAQLLNKDYSAALNTLNNVKKADGMTEYLKAIVNNRMGKTDAAKTALQKAIQLDSSLAAYSTKDLELANLK